MNEDITEKLNDIALPDGVSWWPPAPGWWLVLILIALLAGLLWYWFKYIKSNRVRVLLKDARFMLDQAYQDWLENNNNQAFVAEISVLLRRLALSLYSRKYIAGVTGKAWLEFLDQGMPDKPFSHGVGAILHNGPYQRNLEDDLNLFYQLCCQKIEQFENGEMSV